MASNGGGQRIAESEGTVSEGKQAKVKSKAKTGPLDGLVGRPTVLDACCGRKMMWFDKQDGRAIFADSRRESYPIPPNRGWPNGTTFIVAPDVLQDFTKMGFPDNTFCHVVFDPPHCNASEGRKKGLNAKTYGLLFEGWRGMLRDGFAECFRVLKPDGTLIFKWCEAEIPLREVLALTPEKPLYGHRSGKKSQTHWVAFVKAGGPPVMPECVRDLGEAIEDHTERDGLLDFWLSVRQHYGEGRKGRNEGE